MHKILIILVLSIVFSGCSILPDWIGSEESDAPLPGKRESVLKQKKILKSSNRNIEIIIPAQATNKAWHTQNSTPLVHPALPSSISQKDSAGVGDAPSEGLYLTSAPIIAENKVFTIDGEGLVEARSVANIDKIFWDYEVSEGTMPGDVFGLGVIGFGMSNKEFLGGNIGYGDGILFITTRRGHVIALDERTGKEKWRRDMQIPIISAPSYGNGKVVFLTSDNRIYAISSENGETSWFNRALNETTRIFGATTPVVTGNNVITAFSSGEIHSYDLENGKRLWLELLSGSSRKLTSALGSLSSISATPAISNGYVYVSSHDGEFAALSLKKGKRLWRQDVALSQTPWATGSAVFGITTNGDLAAFSAKNGQAIWVTELPQHAGKMFGDGKGRRITWVGPVLGGGKLWLVSSNGALNAYAPETGKKIAEIGADENIYLAPVIVDNALFTLSNEAELSVFTQ